MAPRDSRRSLVLALLGAILLGLVIGWIARVWFQPSPEDRARDAMEGLRERAREITR